MSITQRLMGKLSFAHLNGPRAAAQAEDEEKKDDDQAKGAAASAEDDKPDDEKKDDKPSAEGDDKKDGDDDDKPADASAEGDKSDEPDGDEDPDKEMSGNSPAAAARRRERARCAAIFACKAAGRNPEMAAALAFTTSMSRTAAIAALEALPVTARGGGDRAARNPSLGAGGGQASGSSAAAAQAGWTKAFDRYTR
jgi:hypothetical protein